MPRLQPVHRPGSVLGKTQSPWGRTSRCCSVYVLGMSLGPSPEGHVTISQDAVKKGSRGEGQKVTRVWSKSVSLGASGPGGPHRGYLPRFRLWSWKKLLQQGLDGSGRLLRPELTRGEVLCQDGQGHVPNSSLHHHDQQSNARSLGNCRDLPHLCTGHMQGQSPASCAGVTLLPGGKPAACSKTEDDSPQTQVAYDVCCCGGRRNLTEGISGPACPACSSMPGPRGVSVWSPPASGAGRPSPVASG